MTCENRIKVAQDIVCRDTFVHTVLHNADMEFLAISLSSVKKFYFVSVCCTAQYNVLT